MGRHRKLELTWVGKDERPRLEPRILVEEPELSVLPADGSATENMLIHGDNLLALKALEQDFAGKVKCIYIDPPFNTGQAFEYYDDGVEQSLWLSLMRDRLERLAGLLREDGTLVVHIDEANLGNLIVLLDEVLGRQNRCSVVTFKQSSVSGPKAANPGLVTIANYLLLYARDKSQWQPNRAVVPAPRDKRYGTYIANFESPFPEWKFCTLREALASKHRLDPSELKSHFGGHLEAAFEDFVLEEPRRVVRLAPVKPKDINEEARRALAASVHQPGRVFRSVREDKSDYYFARGQQLLFYSTKAHLLDGRWVTGIAASNIWDDLLSNNLHNEGGVRFPKGKKPEALIRRLLELTTSPGDLVLDSFAGSGTTGAVAHKLGRRWILVELGEHCYTHVLPRLSAVVAGADPSGISQAVGWQGGGGFRFYRLAPSLLERDRWGNWVINRAYNAPMLSQAMCKHEGYRFEPNPEVWWVHGHATERAFIYVTTETLNHEQLAQVSDEVGPDRSLLICGGAFRTTAEYDNLTLKKIPQAVLHRCEWGRDDYSLDIRSPLAEPSEASDTAVAVAPGPKAPAKRGRKRSAQEQTLPLFDQEGDA
ncbi:MAG: site-specific DNA-methyltransferase [Deltaproteobacteria bacterium]|nr:site-specific DNA-methyltransferase [Deltaproteobacteria bacterium]